jgi:hypothetical protein
MITTGNVTPPAQAGIQRLRGVFDSYDGKRVAEVLPALRELHPNTLLVGSGMHTQRAVDEIRPALRAPLASWSPTETAGLPAMAFRTLIVRDAECLTASQQANLAALLSQSAGDIQVVSMARRPLFPLVSRGMFRDDLYYRLNVVLLEFPGNQRRR